MVFVNRSEAQQAQGEERQEAHGSRVVLREHRRREGAKMVLVVSTADEKDIWPLSADRRRWNLAKDHASYATNQAIWPETAARASQQLQPSTHHSLSPQVYYLFSMFVVQQFVKKNLLTVFDEVELLMCGCQPVVQ